MLSHKFSQKWRALASTSKAKQNSSCVAVRSIKLADIVTVGASALLLFASPMTTPPSKASWPFQDRKVVAVKEDSLKILDGTKKMISSAEALSADADALLHFKSIPDDQQTLIKQIKEAADLVSTISKDVLSQGQFRLAEEVINATSASSQDSSTPVTDPSEVQADDTDEKTVEITGTQVFPGSDMSSEPKIEQSSSLIPAENPTSLPLEATTAETTATSAGNEITSDNTPAVSSMPSSPSNLEDVAMSSLTSNMASPDESALLAGVIEELP
ncbi:hypothetical protein CEUSTIGMA_g2823.t1 [Chlamydomonas eustigma]|uniref:Uncharacterized protein n=1 Tax=Chlamydomonas eustigma TaxID=1157962 RepID=A0A250WXF3_9CHLO|nr:hypothetical protein CEUSTIGMA_g2823.t1 [Chlamydomonas eustigma]|eukprot:GAX75379.1 hypothetical protein CEUSTIGMA_g2823.t1 [Chlamydomonas eustigma]